MTASTTDRLPLALQRTFAARRAGEAFFTGLHPKNPLAGVVCISDQDEPLEDRRTKAVVGSRRVRTFAHKSNLLVAVGVQYDDEPIQLFVNDSPSRRSVQPVGILRRWPRGSRPAAR